MNKIAKLDKKGLQRFGVLFGVMVAGLFGIILPLIFAKPLPYWPWGLWAFFTLWALLWPSSMQWFYLAWMYFGQVLGWVNTRIILGAFFYLLLTPFSCIMALFKKDPLKLTWDKTALTYRLASQRETQKHMERPY